MSARRAAALLWGIQAPGPLINGARGPGEHAFDQTCDIGRGTHLDVVVSGVVIGGRRNCCVAHRPDGGWHVRHMGHAIEVLHEGREIARDSVLHHGDVIEPVAVAPAQREGPFANPRFVFVAPDAPTHGQAVVWSPGEDAHIVDGERAFVIAPSAYADLSRPGPLLRIRRADGEWYIDHLDRGPPVVIAAHAVQAASCTLHSGDVLEVPGTPPLVFELRDT